MALASRGADRSSGGGGGDAAAFIRIKCVCVAKCVRSVCRRSLVSLSETKVRLQSEKMYIT